MYKTTVVGGGGGGKEDERGKKEGIEWWLQVMYFSGGWPCE